jgi:hypothetical protein
MMNARGIATAPVVLISGFVIFVIVIGFLLVSSMAPREALEFEPTPSQPVDSTLTSVVYDTVTMDAHDEVAWFFFDFDRASPVVPPDTVGWDLAFRRFTIVPAAAVADLGISVFDAVTEAPVDGYVESTFGRDTLNTAIDRWYSYSMLSHLLEPNGHVYVVRTAESRYAKLELLSYYCPGVVAGCPTFRYVYRPDGGRVFGQ